MNSAKVEVLLATYNGEPYLSAQIDSILAQTHTNLSILARDDGSTDGTPAILADYAHRFPSRFFILPTGTPTGSASGNFEKLLAASTAPYVALSDQDDVWKSTKIELSLTAMAALESTHGSGMPLLVFTDLEVVGNDLQTINPSLWRQQHIAARHFTDLPRLLMQNVLTGCTALLNRPLIDKALPIPPEAFMHDWWIVLLASIFGSAAALPDTTVLYRQHGGNVVGAVEHGNKPIVPNVRSHILRHRLWQSVVRQAEALQRLHGHSMQASHRLVVEKLIQTQQAPGRVARIRAYLQGGPYARGIRANIGMFWYLWDIHPGD